MQLVWGCTDQSSHCCSQIPTVDNLERKGLFWFTVSDTGERHSEKAWQREYAVVVSHMPWTRKQRVQAQLEVGTKSGPIELLLQLPPLLLKDPRISQNGTNS